jgi:hypothetical protein
MSLYFKTRRQKYFDWLERVGNDGNAVELTSPRRRPGARKPHEIWIPAFAGMTLVA